MPASGLVPALAARISFACANKCAMKRPPLCPMCRQRISRVVQLAGTEEEVDGEMVVPLKV